jgi:dUTP pyrophosphatase
MNKFEKVTFEEYSKHMDDGYTSGRLDKEYNDIKIPCRATKHSAGYDFYSPLDFYLDVGDTITINTGIKCQLDPDKFLAIYPRSGLGFKYRLQLDNTVGCIDADYYNNVKNEGLIFLKISNCGLNDEPDNLENLLFVKKGDAFAQGIITQYFVTDDDFSDKTREGGIGSTTPTEGE